VQVEGCERSRNQKDGEASVVLQSMVDGVVMKQNHGVGGVTRHHHAKILICKKI